MKSDSSYRNLSSSDETTISYCFEDRLTVLDVCHDTVIEANCCDNKLTTLEGCPNSVTALYGSDNELVVLKGCPDSTRNR